jgi:uncharacterized protein (DUF58 family)
MYYPNDDKKVSKLQFSCIAAASLLQLLKRQLDAASLAIFNDEVSYFSASRSAHSHYRMLTNELQKLMEAASENKHTNAVSAIHLVAEQMHRRSLVVVFSDMMDDSENTEQLFSALQHLRYNKHEVILFHVMDAAKEIEFDFENRPYEFVDMESGERIKLQPWQVKEQYTNKIKEYAKTVKERCYQYKIDFVPVDLSQPPNQVLHTFLMKRNKLM